MKIKAVGILTILATAGSLTGGCHSHRATRTVVVHEPAVAVPTEKIIVTEAPPMTRTEVVGTAPDASHVWIAGYWMRVNQRWVWVPGHWEARPRPNVAWVPGHWDKSPDARGWVWTPGHWE